MSRLTEDEIREMHALSFSIARHIVNGVWDETDLLPSQKRQLAEFRVLSDRLLGFDGT